MTGPADDLPDVLATVAQACGTAAALKLAHALGGTTVKVPSKATPSCALTRAVGLDVATAIVEIFGAGDLLIPLGPVGWQRRARAAIVRATEEGRSIRAAARAAGVHERTVKRVRKRMRETEGFPLLDLMREP